MWLDFHWHGRDWNERHKETLERSLAVAEAGGATAIGVMPILKRALVSLERCREYFTLADRCKSPVCFYVHIGLTADKELFKQAA